MRSKKLIDSLIFDPSSSVFITNEFWKNFRFLKHFIFEF